MIYYSKYGNDVSMYFDVIMLLPQDLSSKCRTPPASGTDQTFGTGCRKAITTRLQRHVGPFCRPGAGRDPGLPLDTGRRRYDDATCRCGTIHL